MTIVGLISDTHGLLRPEAVAALAGVDLILHAGDIGAVEVLTHLKAIAPVVAVRGNTDTGAWSRIVPETEITEVEGVRIYMLHDLHTLDRASAGKTCQVVVSGHTHKPVIEHRDGMLFVNPGSAGPRRFSLPLSVGRLVVDGSAVRAELVPLAPAPGA
jgi:uncharacterized protein